MYVRGGAEKENCPRVALFSSFRVLHDVRGSPYQNPSPVEVECSSKAGAMAMRRATPPLARAHRPGARLNLDAEELAQLRGSNLDLSSSCMGLERAYGGRLVARLRVGFGWVSGFRVRL